MFQFQHIEYLWALAAIPLMIFLYLKLLAWKKKAIIKIGDERLVMQLIKDFSPSKFSFKFILIVIAFAAGVIALANPRRQDGDSNIKRSGIDIMIALDVSKSMLAQDISPTRLDRAKQLISKLINKMPDDRIGLVIFAGRAYLQMPLTSDHHAAQLYLSSATPDVVPVQGTVIDDALRMCYAAFNQKEKKYKSIVLISDGEDHDEGALKTAKQLADEGVMINTVGIGSKEGTLIKDPSTGDYKKDEEGNPVITKLNEEELRKIAENGKGLYAFFNSADDITTQLKKQFSTMEQRTITERSSSSYQSYFYIFLLIALLLLLIEFFISEKNKKAIIANVGAALFCIFFFFLPFSMLAQNSNKLIKKGNDAYNQGQFPEASKQYRTVLENDSANTKAQYNLGNSLYKSGKSDSALLAYDNAIRNSKTAKEKAEAWYNKGVILQKNKKLAECIEAYKNSLRLNPEDEDTRLNLQKALQQQKKQQSQQQNKQNEPKENKQKKNDQEKQKDEKKKDESKSQPSKMTKKEAEENLKSLLQREQNLQDKLRKVQSPSPEKQEKDW